MKKKKKNVLLTVLGRNPKETVYKIAQSPQKSPLTKLAPLGLIHLLPQERKPNLVLALCTPDAKEDKDSWPLLEKELAGLCKVKSVDVNLQGSGDTVENFLRALTKEIPRAGEFEITVDLTHGPRHIAFLTFSGSLFLSALYEAPITGVYYGLFGEEGVSTFFDLKSLVNLPRWIHAIQVFKETGSAHPLASLLEAIPPSQNSGKARIIELLHEISQAYLTGLPLELGKASYYFLDEKRKPLRRILKNEYQVPLPEKIVYALQNALKPFSLPDKPTGGGWKKNIRLSREELERQALLVDALLEQNNMGSALGLMREWTVSWTVWRLGLESDWLDFDRTRRKATGVLGTFMSAQKDEILKNLLTETQKELGKFWGLLSGLRNGYHHHAMRPGPLLKNKDDEKKLSATINFWKERLRHVPNWDLSLKKGATGSVLVTPIGNTPGVLYSAILAFKNRVGSFPSNCLIICSKKSKEKISEALQKVGYSGPMEEILIENPFNGIAEIDPWVERLRPRVFGADQVFVNVTGGTTLMGIMAERIAQAALDLSTPVVRFGLIDRRPHEQQKTDPYKAGEPFWFEPQKEDEEE